MSVAAAAVVACAGLVLSSSAAVGQSATAVPVRATGSATREADTLSRGEINREAISRTSIAPDASDPTIASHGADASADPSPEASLVVYYVVTGVYLRDEPSTSGKVVSTLATGTQVTSAGDAASGWQPVTTGSANGYVKSSLLTTTAPSRKTAVQGPAASGPYAACASGSALESGLVAEAILVHRAVCTTFPDITTYGGIRGDGSEHATGRALDIMTSGARGQQIAAWLRAGYSKLGIVEIIYQQQIWTTQRASEGWRPMPDRGSVTANHYDHIHVLVG